MKDADLLYRYMDYERFVKIVNENKLTLANPFKDWDDLHEGFICRLHKKHGEEFLKKYAKENNIDIDMADLILSHIRFNMRAQSWSKSQDCAAMWAAYGYEKKAIMVGVQRQAIEELTYNGHPVKVVDIVYEKDLTVEKELKKIFTRDLHAETEKVLEIKRDCFSYENEVRIIKELYGSLDREGDSDILAIPPASSFIKNVLIHPKADNDFCDAVRNFCKDHNILNVMRSTLLDEPML